MRGKDRRLSARSFLLACSGNTVQGSPSLTLTPCPQRALCTHVPAALWGSRSEAIWRHAARESITDCPIALSIVGIIAPSGGYHWEDLTLLTPLPLPVLFPWIPAQELAREERRTWQIEERHDRKESSTALQGPIQVLKCITSTWFSQIFRSWANQKSCFLESFNVGRKIGRKKCKCMYCVFCIRRY